MIYTNSIEGYCNNPLSEDQIRSISQTLQERARRKSILLGAYAITSLLAVILIGLGAYSTVSAQEAAEAVVGTLAASLFFGLLLKQTLHPYLSVTIKIGETDMAISPDFFNEIPNPLLESLPSPMARQLVENIQRAGRKALVFEQNLMGKL